MEKRKIIKYSLILSVFCIFIYMLIYNTIGIIDISGTLSAKYTEINDSQQIIETSNFIILTPKNWIHIEEANEMDSYCAFFWTGSDFVEYEIGAGGFYDCEYHGYLCKIDTINGRIIQVVRNENKIGIAIANPISLTFGVSKSVKSNYNDLLTGIETMKFKWTNGNQDLIIKEKE